MTQHVMAAALIVLIVSQGISAKRGCSAFGHSCFGGHGKRSSDNAAIDFLQPQTGEMVGYHRQLGQEETSPKIQYPNNEVTGILTPGDDIIPIRDGGVYDHEDNAFKEYLKFNLRKIVKHWMNNYKRTQDNAREYIAESQ